MAWLWSILLVICGSCMVFAEPDLPPKCALVLCAAPTCLKHYTPPGECCPVCPKGDVKPGICPIAIQDPFAKCAPQCEADSDCPDITKCCDSGCGGRRCRTPITTGKRCVYKGSVYKDGQSFMDDCNTCTCTDGMVGCTKIGCTSLLIVCGSYITNAQSLMPPKCAAMFCMAPDCPDAYVPPGECCPICPKDKPGNCPQLGTGFSGICVEMCSSDKDCALDYKCCSNGCGHTCQKPAGGDIVKPGKCPRRGAGIFGICVEMCSSDKDCALDYKCCSNGCGHTCQKPTGGDPCNAVLCPKLKCFNQYTPPGECCPKCGSIFPPKPDPCDAVLCPKLRCFNQYTPPGECCPKCGPIFPPKPDCTRVACAMVACVGESYIPPGECCPSCRNIMI